MPDISHVAAIMTAVMMQLLREPNPGHLPTSAPWGSALPGLQQPPQLPSVSPATAHGVSDQILALAHMGAARMAQDTQLLRAP